MSARATALHLEAGPYLTNLGSPAPKMAPVSTRNDGNGFRPSARCARTKFEALAGTHQRTQAFCAEEKKQNTTVLYALATRRTRVEWVRGGFGCVEGRLESRKEGRFIEFEQEEVV